MKSTAFRRAFIPVIFSMFTLAALGQIPGGFNYQAIARDNDGNILADASLPVRLTIQTSLTGGTIIYQETFASVVSNKFGLITLVVGTGTQTEGTAKSFSEIDWKATNLFIRTEIQYPGPAWINMGTSQFWSVPYALVARDVSTLSKLGITGATDLDDPLFEVKNKGGFTVFAVYNNAVRAYVGKEVTKGVRGGFSVGGYDGSKGLQDYFKVYGDSTRVYVRNQPKGVRGGFSVGGYDGSKGVTGNFVDLTKENYLIGHESGKNLNGGLFNSFIGYQAGYKTTTGFKNYFIGYRAGYNNVSGFSNTFIGDSAGFKNSTGFWNTFIGDWTGYTNTSGNRNLFIGHRAGVANTTGICNIFLGPDAGGSNTTAWYNTFVGIGAGYMTTTGGYNSYYGINSGFAMKTGVNNAFYGSNSGYWFDGGNGNTFIGAEAGRGGPDNDPADPSGNDNTAIGSFTGIYLENGSGNTMIGAQTGFNMRTGTNNVFLGYQAGYSETGSNKLYVSNSNAYTPLLYGDFSLHQLGINTTTLSKTLNVGGDVSVSGNITATTINGSLTGTVTGTVTGSLNGNVTGNLSGNVNGVEMGSIYLTEKGTIQSLFGNTFLLSFDPTHGLILLENLNKDYWCNYFFRIINGASVSSGSGILLYNQNVTVINDKIFDNTGFEIHFGQTASSAGYCSVWVQYFNGVLVGHYIKQ
jgi:hypothetical protein